MKNIKLELSLPDTPAPVIADRDRLMQVMLNLLTNSIKFCESDRGEVRVTVSSGSNVARVDVRDNGVGIAPENQELIFEKFRQVGDALTEKPPGTGLGLAICRQIVGHFGGRLWVESTQSQGATFSFSLPLSTAAAD